MSKVSEYVERKQKSILSQLENEKWWQQPHDPRPIKSGDVVKTRGREVMSLFPRESLKRSQPGIVNRDQPTLNDLLVDLDITDAKEVAVIYNLYAQPGFKCRVNDREELVFDSDVFISSRTLYSYFEMLSREASGKVEEFIRVDKDLMNKYFPGIDSVFLKPYERTILEREDPVANGPTNYEVFSDLMSHLDLPGLTEIYPDLAKSFKLNYISLDDIEELREFAPYLEWSRKYGGDGIDKFKADHIDILPELRFYKHKFEEIGLDPETNAIEWDNPSETWQRGDFSVIGLHTTRDFVRQGNFLNQCLYDTESQPYFAMVDAGHWQMYSLLNKTGRPVASICVADAGGKNLVVLENRGQHNTPLSLDGAREGKAAKYAEIIDTWLEDLRKQGYTVNRDSENIGYAPLHESFGLAALGYNADFDGELVPDGPEHWETEVSTTPQDGRQEVYTFEDMGNLMEYMDAMKDHPEYFIESDPYPDYDYRTNYYDEGSEIDISKADLDTLLNEICDMNIIGRDMDELIECLATLHVAIQHEDALRYSERYDETRDYILAYLDDRYAEAETEDVMYSGSNHYKPIGAQLDLEFVEGDQKEWINVVAKTAHRIFSMERVNKNELPGVWNRGSFKLGEYLDEIKRNEQELNRRQKPKLRDHANSPKLLDGDKSHQEFNLDL